MYYSYSWLWQICRPSLFIHKPADCIEANVSLPARRMAHLEENMIVARLALPCCNCTDVSVLQNQFSDENVLIRKSRICEYFSNFTEVTARWVAYLWVICIKLFRLGKSPNWISRLCEEVFLMRVDITCLSVSKRKNVLMCWWREQGGIFPEVALMMQCCCYWGFLMS